MADIIGWIGSICFALCGVPQAWKCYKEGHALGLSGWFLILWLTGEACYITGVLMKFGWVDWMMFNYVINVFCIIAIIRYKLFPSVSEVSEVTTREP